MKKQFIISIVIATLTQGFLFSQAIGYTLVDEGDISLTRTGDFINITVYETDTFIIPVDQVSFWFSSNVLFITFPIPLTEYSLPILGINTYVTSKEQWIKTIDSISKE